MGRRIEAAEGVALAEFEPEWIARRLQQPVEVLHDEGDRVAPIETSRRLVQTLAQARLHATRGLGHARILDNPDVARQVGRWLAEPGSPAAPRSVA
jgi:pimeloyl-ACP methyl ester carboxylesterase